MRKKAFIPPKAGFTLIELIIVIAILSILAAMIIPRFSNLQTQAIDKKEDAIITTLKEAINQRHMYNITSGKGDVWPGATGDQFTSSPYELLNPVLVNCVFGTAGTPDNGLVAKW